MRFKELVEKLSAKDDMGKWIDDFKKSDAPQFAGKSDEERRKMAIAAKLQADREAGVKEGKVELDPVDKSQLKKKYDDRDDKDIDNDGDEDESDEYLHKKRKAISKAVDEETEQIEEAAGDKTAERLKQLVRLGLMDKSKMNVLVKSLEVMNSGKVPTPQQRDVLFELVNELIGIVTGDDSVFTKVKMKVQKEEIELDEKKSDYTIHHSSYSSAVQHAVDHTNKTSGMTVDDDDYDRKVAMGPRKPSEGKTNEFHLDLVDKNGKTSKKKLHMQVYGMGNGKYELNKYVS